MLIKRERREKGRMEERKYERRIKLRKGEKERGNNYVHLMLSTLKMYFLEIKPRILKNLKFLNLNKHSQLYFL